jgi:hypothetical protein
MNTSESIYKPKPRKPKVELPVEPVVKVDPLPGKIPANVWPRDEDKAIEEVFGRVSDYDYSDDGRPNRSWESSYLQKLDLPYAMRLAWNLKGPLVRHIYVNRAVYGSLAAILQNIYDLYGRDMNKIQAARMDIYGGCYNFRPRRGGHRLSLHAWGAAIDFDPENNPHGKKWEEGKGMIHKEVVEIFMREGWKWGGTFNNPDSMHFEATS